MPTFSRLVAAVLFAVLGVGVSFLAMPYFEPVTRLDGLPLGAAAAGVIVGWYFTGPRFQRQTGDAIAIGMTSAVAQAVLTLFGFSAKLMVDRAFRSNYDTVMEAVVGVFDAALEYLVIVGQPDVVLAALIGGSVIGIITNWVSVRTR